MELDENKFLLASLTCACKIRNDTIKTKLPVFKGMFCVLLEEIEKYLAHNQIYLSLLYKTLLLTMYFGLFRSCELTVTPSGHAVKVTDIQIGFNKKKFMFILRSSKHIIRVTSSRSLKFLAQCPKMANGKKEIPQGFTIALPIPTIEGVCKCKDSISIKY